MKRLAILLILFCFFSFNGFAQEKTKKQLKQESQLKKQKEIEVLINSKNFVFDAEKVYPQGTRMINLDYNTYTLKFNSENVVCDLPFFGRAFNVGYGSDGGIKFEGKPQNIRIEQKGKKYLIRTTVNGTNDVYDLLFTIFYDGGTSVNINSNNRASISYDGRIRAPKETEIKK